MSRDISAKGCCSCRPFARRHRLYLVVAELVDNVRVGLGVPFYFVGSQVHPSLGRPPGRHGCRGRALATVVRRQHSVLGVHLRPVHGL